MSFFITIFLCIVFFLVIEVLHRWLHISVEFSRKIVHVGSAAGMALLPYFLSKIEILAICFILFAILLASRYLHLNEQKYDNGCRIFARLRDKFQNLISGASRFLRWLNVYRGVHSIERKTLGELYFPIGVALSAFIFLPASAPTLVSGQANIVLFQFGVLVMGFADTTAAIIGVHYGKHKFTFVDPRAKIFGAGASKKSVEGSSAFFVTTFLILLFFNFFSIEIKLSGFLVLPIVLSFLELILSFGLDNLILPVVASFLLGIFIL